MLFDYKAVSTEGRMVVGRLDAVSPDDLELRLQRMDLDLVLCRPRRTRRPAGRGRIGRRELIHFCFHLEQLIRSGVPILDGLADLRDSTEHPRLRETVAGLVAGIEGGLSLSQAMAAHPQAFGPVFVNLVRAGEASGQLPEVLANLTESIKWEDELASHTKKLLLYPALVGTLVLAASAFLMIYLVPQLKLFVGSLGQALPPHTRALFFAADLLAADWPFFALSPLIAAVALQLVLRSDPLARLHLDGIKLRLPVVGPVLEKIALSRFADTFAMLYAAGIPILDAIDATREVVGNRALQRALQEVGAAIREGAGVAAAFGDSGLFPPLVVRMLRIGESTGALDRSLRNVGYFYNRDVRETVDKAQAMLAPLLTAAMGLLLGWIMLAVIGPIYDVVGRLAP